MIWCMKLLPGLDMKPLVAIMLLSAMTACGTTQERYSISCSADAPDWGECDEKARARCREKGYEILGKNANYSGYRVTNRSMEIKCKE